MPQFPLYDLPRNTFDKLVTTVIGKCKIVKHSTDLRLFLFTRNLAWNVTMSQRSLDEEKAAVAKQNSNPLPKTRPSRMKRAAKNTAEEPQAKAAKLSKQQKASSRNADGQKPRQK
ncbi:hypothetical protein CRE_19147 [Caenorhabditis remanei]|uniref:Uncharacterized protein n=2 Tax=Caenorhabditis remanei TaxID=31234 RepID=E3MJJ8_CAERE|nr:hypothetical protein CRE_19147 [Caenorhabditis remanei]